MDRTADCVIVTRFNLPSRGVESLIRAQDGWLRNRIELFERYCLPSVRAQTDPRFQWLIYLDPLSPQWLLDRLAPNIDAGTFTTVYREQVSAQGLLEDVANLVGTPHGGDLITTSLDNDDALAVDYVQRLRAVTFDPGSVAIYFEFGLVRTESCLYLHRDRVNAFGAVRAPWAAPLTCWTDWHTRLGRHMPVVVVPGPPAWLQVIHGQNVSNRVRGRLVAPSTYRSAFAGALDGLVDPPRSDLARDLLIAGPRRRMRESARAAVKQATLTIAGPDGLDRVKHRVALVRARVRRKSAGAS